MSELDERIVAVVTRADGEPTLEEIDELLGKLGVLKRKTRETLADIDELLDTRLEVTRKVCT